MTFACPLFIPIRIVSLSLLLFAGPVLAALDADLLQGLAARSIGPAAVSGRITSIDVVRSNPKHMVIGAATGGVWISHNAGLTWTPVFDDQPVASIGAVAINQQNPDIIWVGTGEGNVRNSTSIGAGMFKSVDGGRSWKQVGLAASERINRIALHPDNPDVAYVAAMGTLWGENEERGIYKTSDGGASWQRVLYSDQKTGGTDVKLDPFNPEKVYASLWQFRRWPYFFKSGGPGSGMFISWNGGKDWGRKTEDDGLPAGELGRITIAPSAAEAGRLYALVEAEKSALLRSDNGGDSWSRVNESYDIMSRPFYYTEIAADPQNADRVYNIFENLAVSIDGGKSFENNPVVVCCAPGNFVHIDNHAFWINPDDPKHLVIGNDGGIAISLDRGATWRFVSNLPLSQFYHIAVDNDLPYNIYGGLQDNGSWRGPSTVWETGGIRNLHWQDIGFGDGFDALPDPENARQGYSMSQGGNLSRWNLDTGEQRLIRPDPQPINTDLRFNWNAGLAQDPFDAGTIYYGSQFLHKSTDRGESWTVISPDLTSNNPEFQTFRNSGGITLDVTAAENYTTIVSVAASPLEQGLLWVGTDDGRVHVTRDGGENWNRIDGKAKGVNAGAWVPMIAPSPHAAGTAFVVLDDHRRSDMRPHVYRVDNYGVSWTSLATDEISGYALSVLQDHEDPDLIFLGTELGLHISTDGGSSWTKFTAGVPTVSVMDMAIQKRENDLVLGTHGRSIFVLDDYSALRGLSSDSFKQRLQILSVSPGQQYVARATPSTRFTGSGEFRAVNEPYGVLLTFVASGKDLPHPQEEQEKARKQELREEGSGTKDKDPASDASKAPKVQVTVSDSNGTVIRRFKSPVAQGINRLNWNLRHDGVRPMPAPKPPEADADLPTGAEVPPGKYRISLSLGDGETQRESAVDVTVLADPRLAFSQADREANYQSLLALQALQETSVTAVERIVAVRNDLDTLNGLIAKQDESTAAALKKQSGDLQDQLKQLELRFRVMPETAGHVYDDDKVASRIGAAQYYVGSSLDAATPASAAFVQLAENELDSALAELNAFLSGPLQQFRDAVNEAGVGLLAESTAISRNP